MSIGNEYKNYTKNSRITTINYCKKYNYDFIEDESVYDKSRAIPWSKILLLLKYINYYDYVIWIDADILIMNDQIKLEDKIDAYNKYDIICGSDNRMINTGFLFVKNSLFSRQFLNAVYNNVYDPLADPNERYKNWEQGSFINLWDKNYLNCQSKIKVTEPREINSYWGNYHYGDFVLHAAGVRGSLLEYFINRFVPIMISTDTYETYNERMRYLREDFRKEHDEMKKNWKY